MFNITNYFDHPSRPGFTVFKFHEEQRARYFEELLKEQSIWYESTKDEKVYLFGIRKGDYRTALKANYLVSGKYRKKTVPNRIVRWTFYLLVIVGLTLAIIGMIKS